MKKLTLYLAALCLLGGFALATASIIGHKTPIVETVEILDQTDVYRLEDGKKSGTMVYEYEIHRPNCDECGTDTFYLVSFKSFPCGLVGLQDSDIIDIIN